MPLCEIPVRVDRWRWLVTGQVQGVGFRPFVYHLAQEMGLSGFVRNDARGVVVECQGDRRALVEFESQLKHRHPRLASIHQIQRSRLPVLRPEAHFHIIESERPDPATCAGADVTVDTATCDKCVREILCSTDRRFGYGLTNCTECGPRYSIVRKIPYDRCNTTMSHFDMCPSCQVEYVDPSDRRFHAQPIACHECGPKVALVDVAGDPLGGDPIDEARNLLRAGKILAVKGLGGFHLAVRADDESAVDRLRQLKKRDHKPFAVMVPSIEVARRIVELSEAAISLMQSPACPIVLAARRVGANVAPCVAPRNHRLGVMLPYTPIHHLLLRDLPALVMTSGNASDEPLAIENREALDRLGPMCDAILWHDRPIQRGVDDSVVIDTGGADPIFVRRARGYVPAAIALPVGRQTQGLCLGGELKSTIAVVRGGSAILSQHLGDLTYPAAYEAFRTAIDDLRGLFTVTPQWIAHDLHPMYVSTAHARRLAAGFGVPAMGIQHHHAHAAALLAEHGLDKRILAVICDGTGYGLDGSTWGGELLAADLLGFDRVTHLRPLHLPGGDAAARDTTRSGLAMLYSAFGPSFEHLPVTRELIPDEARRGMLCRMILNNVACASSTGAGRWFDGAAAILGICPRNHHEAQAAMMLESIARSDGSRDDRELFDIAADEIDLSPLVRELVLQHSRGGAVEELAMLFHEQFARAWARVVVDAAERLRLRVVGLSGGVFCNALLTRRLTELLEDEGLSVLRHRVVPPNDGGLALGQAAVAAARYAALRGKDGAPCAWPCPQNS